MFHQFNQREMKLCGDACQDEQISFSSFWKVRSGILLTMKQLSQFSPRDWNPKIKSANTILRPSDFKAALIPQLFAPEDIPEMSQKNTMDCLNEILKGLTDKLLVCMLWARLANACELFIFGSMEFTPLLFHDKFIGMEYSIPKFLETITGKPVTNDRELEEALKDPETHRHIEEVLNDSNKQHYATLYAEQLITEQREFLGADKILNEVDEALDDLFIMAKIYADRELLKNIKNADEQIGDELERENRFRSQRERMLDFLISKKEKKLRSLIRLKRGLKSGTKKRPKALDIIKAKLKIENEETFYQTLYQKIKDREDSDYSASKPYIAKQLKLDNIKQLQRILDHFGDTRSWTAIKAEALKP